MKHSAPGCLTGLLLLVVLALPAEAAEPLQFRFRDVTRELGVLPAVEGMYGHAAAWGDADGDGRLDLYVGAFTKGESTTNRLLLNREQGFTLHEQPELRVAARSSGAVFADFDNDGDNDFYLSNLAGGRQSPETTENFLFRNEGGGKFTNITAASGSAPAEFRGRSVAAFDYNGDGLLDLLLGESTAYGSAEHSRLLKNEGGLKFKDVTAAAGLPEKLPGLGVAAGDLTNDGWPDVVFVAGAGNLRVFINNREGAFREAPKASAVLQEAWKGARGDNMVCGVCLGDVNGDGRLDVVIGPHYERPWLEPVAVRLYLNRGGEGESLELEDVTEAAGLTPLALKAPHVELHDFDNDGRLDLYTSIVTNIEGAPQPMIFRQTGLSDGVPQFREDISSRTDFPTAEDRAITRTGSFFEKMVADKKVTYMAAAPAGDFDNDGRIDLFLASWWPELPSLLLKNETQGGNWLTLRAGEHKGLNRSGIGLRVYAYTAGKADDPAALLAWREISAGYGYSCGQPALAYLGFELAEERDLAGSYLRRGVAANQVIEISPAAE